MQDIDTAELHRIATGLCDGPCIKCGHRHYHGFGGIGTHAQRAIDGACLSGETAPTATNACPCPYLHGALEVASDMPPLTAEQEREISKLLADAGLALDDEAGP